MMECCKPGGLLCHQCYKNLESELAQAAMAWSEHQDKFCSECMENGGWAAIVERNLEIEDTMHRLTRRLRGDK